MNQQENKQLDEKDVLEIVKKYTKTNDFTMRKITDTPTDALSVVNRKYVTQNGSIAAAPITSIVGQRYFASDLGYPVFKNTIYRWVNSVGSVVG